MEKTKALSLGNINSQNGIVWEWHSNPGSLTHEPVHFITKLRTLGSGFNRETYVERDWRPWLRWGRWGDYVPYLGRQLQNPENKSWLELWSLGVLLPSGCGPETEAEDKQELLLCKRTVWAERRDLGGKSRDQSRREDQPEPKRNGGKGWRPEGFSPWTGNNLTSKQWYQVFIPLHTPRVRNLENTWWG